MTTNSPVLKIASQDKVDLIIEQIKLIAVINKVSYEQYLNALLKQAKIESLSELNEQLADSLIKQFDSKLPSKATFPQRKIIEALISVKIRNTGVSLGVEISNQCRKYNQLNLYDLTKIQASHVIRGLHISLNENRG